MTNLFTHKSMNSSRKLSLSTTGIGYRLRRKSFIGNLFKHLVSSLSSSNNAVNSFLFVWPSISIAATSGSDPDSLSSHSGTRYFPLPDDFRDILRRLPLLLAGVVLPYLCLQPMWFFFIEQFGLGSHNLQVPYQLQAPYVEHTWVKHAPQKGVWISAI